MKPVALDEGAWLTASTGQRCALGALIKRGGAGSVYLLRDDSERVAKIYHSSRELALYEGKLEAMLELAPRLPELCTHQGFSAQLAWPSALVRDASGHFRGFLMPKLDPESHFELELMLHDRQALAAGLSPTLGPRVTLAANLSAVVAELHREEHFVVDLKPTNVRFHRHTLQVALLDCDGFSIRGRGQRYPATQVTPDYLAPECQGRPIPSKGEVLQDRFALAVIIFRLLSHGVHPFTGRPLHARVPTDIPGRIARRCYAYGVAPSRDLAPNPMSFHELMPMQLRGLFDRAFAENHEARPSALEWAEALKTPATRASGQIQSCARDPAHQHFAGRQCAACAREELLARTLSTASTGPAPRSSVLFVGPAGTSVGVGSIKPPGRDHTFLVGMLLVVLVLGVGVSTWLVKGGSEISPYGPMFVPAPKHRPRTRPAPALGRPVTEVAFADLHRVVDAAAFGTRSDYDAEMRRLRASAGAPEAANVAAARAVSALVAAFDLWRAGRNAELTAKAKSALQRAQQHAMGALLNAPDASYLWTILALTYSDEQDAQRAVGAFAIAALLDKSPHGPSWSSEATTRADARIKARVRILEARGLVAAARLGGAPYTPETQALAETDLPP